MGAMGGGGGSPGGVNDAANGRAGWEAAVRRDIVSTYERWARSYDPVLRLATLGFEPRLRRRLIARLGLRPGDRVLDLCCGTGLNLPAIREAVGSEGEVVGIDLTPAMLAQARRKVEKHGWRNVRLLQADATTYRPERPLDAALSTGAAGLFPDPEALVRTLVAAARPGGTVLVCDVQALGGRRGRFLDPLMRLVGAPWVPARIRDGYWTARPWTALCRLTESPQYEEWLGGALYVAWGRRPAGP